MKKSVILISMLIIASCSKTTSNIENAKKSIESKYPNIQITSIEKINQSFFEVRVGTEIYYLTSDLKHLIAGNIIEMSSGKNLTENSYKQTRLEYLSQITDNDVISYTSKDSKHTLTIFTDTSCPYCQKLHNEIKELVSNGISVNYVLFSRNGNDTEAYKDMVSVWCSDDRQYALDMLFDNSFVDSKTCENPISNNYTKAMNLQVNGTPMIFFEDGSVIPGYVASDKIIDALKASH